MPEIVAVIPTLGRETLKAAKDSLEKQTQPVTLLIKQDERDTLIKLKEAVDSGDSELIAVCDDDAVYPANWVQTLAAEFEDPKVGYAGGACVPMVENASESELYIAKVTQSFMGGTNMSYRGKVPKKTKDVGEMSLVGNGLYRRSVLKEILDQEYDKIPPAAWETYILTRIKKKGFKTLSVKGAFFMHHQRTSLFAFVKQIFRCATGRMEYFRRFNGQLLPKFFTIMPIFLVIDVIAIFFPLIWVQVFAVILLVFYLFVLATGWVIAKVQDRETSPLFMVYLFAMHFAYGLGLIWGLVAGGKKTWS